MDDQDPPPAQPQRKRRSIAQIQKDRLKREADRKQHVAATRKMKKEARDHGKPQLTEERAKFWKSIMAQSRGVGARIAESMGVHPSTLTGWGGGSGWHAENISMLLDHTPPYFNDAQRAELIRLSLRSCGYSENSVQIITATDAVLDLRRQQAASDTALDLRRQEVEWFSEVVTSAASDITYILPDVLSANDPGNDNSAWKARKQQRQAVISRAIYAVLNHICAFYVTRYADADAARVCIYTPLLTAPTLIGIRWNKKVDGDTQLWNEWFIGDDPVPPNRYRGLAGRTWRAEAGRWFPRDVFDHPEFEDRHEPRRTRETMPYDSLVQAQILGKGQQKLGLLSVDSKKHEFSDFDLQLMNHVTLLLAPLLELYDQL